MRTFVILVAGWLAGGVIVVILDREPIPSSGELSIVSAAQLEPSALAAAAKSPVRSTGYRTLIPMKLPVARSAVAIPVLGIRASDLRDTFTERRGGGRTHGAIDILAPRGTPVIAAVDGTIRKLFDSRAGGLTVYQFDGAEERVYYYAHLDAYAEGLTEGDVVSQGTVLGYVGTTGNAAADTPHLHFSVEDLPPSKEWWKGTPVNPYPLLLPDGAVPH